jgi:predicted Zn-dependent peptidase
MLIGPIGSRNGFTTIFREEKRIAISCGCFYGSLEEFAERVNTVYPNSQHGKDYQLMIELVKSRFQEER